ncbi:MAG: hypothetical protein P1U77_16515 [Rubripirellula sp.]|nr:hypothetical protein [Rubripirellula sp.]
MSIRQLLIVVLLAGGGLGCRDARNLSQQLDGTADATYSFWVRLQGIKYRTAQKTHSIYVSNLATARAQDLDALAKGFNAAASHHGQIARELELLDSVDADSIAVDYRDQLVASHKNLERQFRACADATSSRAVSGVDGCKQELEPLLEFNLQLWDGRELVMSNLKDKFDREFNYVD